MDKSIFYITIIAVIAWVVMGEFYGAKYITTFSKKLIGMGE